jgi:hypothetical protein
MHGGSDIRLGDCDKSRTGDGSYKRGLIMLHKAMFAVAMLATASAAHAQPLNTSVGGQAAADLYTLQERCAAQARRYVKSQGVEQPTTWNGVYFSADYENHYNARLNKCFMVINITMKLVRKDKPTLVEITSALMDANERRTLGVMVSKNNSTEKCIIKTEQCNSTATWYALLSEYMED